jgi:hypothetical protein
MTTKSEDGIAIIYSQLNDIYFIDAVHMYSGVCSDACHEMPTNSNNSHFVEINRAVLAV